MGENTVRIDIYWEDQYRRARVYLQDQWQGTKEAYEVRQFVRDQKFFYDCPVKVVEHRIK